MWKGKQEFYVKPTVMRNAIAQYEVSCVFAPTLLRLWEISSTCRVPSTKVGVGIPYFHGLLPTTNKLENGEKSHPQNTSPEAVRSQFYYIVLPQNQSTTPNTPNVIMSLTGGIITLEVMVKFYPPRPQKYSSIASGLLEEHCELSAE